MKLKTIHCGNCDNFERAVFSKAGDHPGFYDILCVRCNLVLNTFYGEIDEVNHDSKDTSTT